MTETSISSPSAATEDVLVCARPIMEPPRLRPPHDQALKCPRCDSTHTKFCYYNNYSLSQPRYFCKTCRRYWTKGGTLRNIPVGGGCRKVKKPAASATPNNKIKRVVTSSDNSNSSNSNINTIIDLQPMLSGPTATDLHLSFPEVSSFTGLFGSCLGNMGPATAVLESRFCGQPFDFLESKVKADHQGGAVVNVGESSSCRSHDYMGNIADGELSVVGGPVGENFHVDTHLGFDDQHGLTNFYNGPMGSSSFDEGKHNLPDTCQRMMLPYEGYDDEREHDRDSNAAIDVKPLTSSRLLSLDWQDQVYLNGIGSWNNMMCTFGPSTTNPLV